MSGGARAGRQLLGAVSANGAAGTLFSWSVFLAPVGADVDRGDELGLVLSTALVAFALTMLAGGSAVDRHGPRRVTLASGTLCGAGLAVAAVAQDAATLHLGVGVLFGAGSGLTYLATVSWATRDRGVGRTGLVVAAYAAGPVLAAPLGGLGADTWGWRPTLAVAAVVVGGVVLLAGRALPGPVSPEPAPAGAPRPSQGSTGPVGDGVALWSLWVLFLASTAPGLLAFAYAAAIVVERGVGVGAAGLVVATMAGGNLLGRLLAGSLCHLVGRVPALGVTAVGLTGALVVLSSLQGGTVTVTALVALSVQYGLVSALLPVATAPVSTHARFATAYGRVFSSFGVAAVAGPALGLLLHTDGDGYAGAFRASLVAPVLVAAALVTYRRRLADNV